MCGTIPTAADGLGPTHAADRGHDIAGRQCGGSALNTTVLRLIDDDLTVVVLTRAARADARGPKRTFAVLYHRELSGRDDRIPCLRPADPDCIAAVDALGPRDK